MNSIEIAKKLIAENEPHIGHLRSRENEIRQRIKELELEIERKKHTLHALENDLARQHECLAEVQAEKQERLVNELALRTFVLNGGGLDMLD